MDSLAENIKALSDLTRLKILKLVSCRELCVCEIMEVLGVTSSCVSQHLSKLKAAGLVEERRDAQWVYYAANTSRLRELAQQIVEVGLLPLSETSGMDMEVNRFSKLATNPRIRACKSRP